MAAVIVLLLGVGIHRFQAAQHEKLTHLFLRVSAATFPMGSPNNEPGRNVDEPLRDVTLTRDFLIQATEVTQGQYQALMGENPSFHLACGPRCPVDQVSWLDAALYANAKSEQEGLPPCFDKKGRVIGGQTVYDCKGYRLPTQAEWELAARGGPTPGSRYGEPDEIGWHQGNAESRTHPVGTREPNPLGLYDMLGNAWEWCHDRIGRYPEDLAQEDQDVALDPLGAVTGSFRVNRGGSFSTTSHYLRAAQRNRFDAETKIHGLGFRLVRTE